MKQILFILLLSVGVLTTFAQNSAELSKQEQYNQEVRSKLLMDYSIPDFSTSKLDPKIIGDSLSKMLRKLQDNSHDSYFNHKLSHIVCEQNPTLKYVTIDKFSIKNISKSGHVMTIKANAMLDKVTAGVKTAEIVMSFDNGVSNSQTINELFSYLGRYCR